MTCMRHKLVSLLLSFALPSAFVLLRNRRDHISKFICALLLHRYFSQIAKTHGALSRSDRREPQVRQRRRGCGVVRTARWSACNEILAHLHIQAPLAAGFALFARGHGKSIGLPFGICWES